MAVVADVPLPLRVLFGTAACGAAFGAALQVPRVRRYAEAKAKRSLGEGDHVQRLAQHLSLAVIESSHSLA